ncbi:MAG: ATP-binding cassette domain-containing protein [Lacunisphaera sp.]
MKRGEIVGLLGPNGAGKSTTMRILTGYLPANSGSVHICGQPVASHPEATKRNVGYMPENNPLPEDMRVSEYLWFRGRLKEMPRAKLRARIDEVLELCDLKRNRHRILGRLSKGNKQRVGIAEAILAEPAVIIMDEPTIGLDPHQIIIVRNLIASLRGRMSVIISSHILPEIEETCDRVLIINGGRIVAQGSPADLRHEIFGHTTYRLELAGDPRRAAGPPRHDRAQPAHRHAGGTQRRRLPPRHADDGGRGRPWRKTPAGAARRRLPDPLAGPHPALARGRLPRRHPPQLGRPACRTRNRRKATAARPYRRSERLKS